jgi:protein TonB
MFAADRTLRAPAPGADRPGSRSLAWAAALHVLALLLLLGAAGTLAPTRFDAAEFQVVPLVEQQAAPLVTAGQDDMVDGASIEAPPAPDLASGGEAPTPRLEAGSETGPDREQSLARASAPSLIAAPPEPPPLPQQKPSPPVMTAEAASEPPPRPAAKPKTVAPGKGADIINPDEDGGGARGSPDRSGNRYLALVRSEIERQRVYPSKASSRAPEGTAVFVLVVDRNGRLLVLQLSKSSGAAALDDTGAEMIRRAAPLPPLPPEIPGEAVELEVALALFPR